MANDRHDVFSDISDIYRRLENLETSARVPTVSQADTKPQFSQSITIVAGTRTATGWGDMDVTPGGPAAPEITLKDTGNGRVLFIWGTQAGVWTTSGGGNNERAGMGLQVNVDGVGQSGPDSAPAMLQLDLASAELHGNISGMKVVGGFDRGATIEVTAKFYRHNASSFGVSYVNPWLLAMPL